MTATEKIADMQAIIDYITTLSRIHKQRISVFTIPPIGDKGRYTSVEVGFGRSSLKLSGYEDDLYFSWYDGLGTIHREPAAEVQRRIGENAANETL